MGEGQPRGKHQAHVLKPAAKKPKAKTRLQKVVQAQSLIRMFISKVRYRKLKLKFRALKQETADAKAERELVELESQCVNEYLNHREKVFIANQYHPPESYADRKKRLGSSVDDFELQQAQQLDRPRTSEKGGLLRYTCLLRPSSVHPLHRSQSEKPELQLNSEDIMLEPSRQNKGKTIIDAFLSKNQDALVLNNAIKTIKSEGLSTTQLKQAGKEDTIKS